MASNWRDELTLVERFHEAFLRMEQAKIDCFQGQGTSTPFSTAADLLADVPLCLAAIAALNILTTGQDLSLR
jgi:hypothetical protein